MQNETEHDRLLKEVMSSGDKIYRKRSNDILITTDVKFKIGKHGNGYSILNLERSSKTFLPSTKMYLNRLELEALAYLDKEFSK